MTSLSLNPAIAFPQQISTSGSGVLRQMQKLVIWIGGDLMTTGTAAADVEVLDRELAFAEQTNSGLTVMAPMTSHAAAISELRRRSGLTWDQIARLFGVARRSVHFWISGKALNASNEERLNRLLSVVRYIDRGSGPSTRGVLMSAQSDGVVPFDLLANGQFDQVIGRLGQGRGREVSVSAKLLKQPRPILTPSPDRLVGALQDTVHKSHGPAKAARSVKVKKSQ